MADRLISKKARQLRQNKIARNNFTVAASYDISNRLLLYVLKVSFQKFVLVGLGIIS